MFRWHWYFICWGGPFTLLLVFFIPPFQSPDEYAHFFRAYQISEGKFIPVIQDQRVGGLLPTGIKQFADQAAPWLAMNPGGRWNPTILNKLSRIPLQPEKRLFVDFNNSAMTPPVPYVPAALFMAIGRWLGATPLIIYYLGRIGTALAWLLLTWGALRITPVFMVSFTIIALLPMTVFRGATLNHDAVTIGGLFLFIASVFRLWSGDVSRRHEIGHAALSLLAVSVKWPYALVLLLPLIPLPGQPLKARKLIVRCSLWLVLPALLWCVWFGQSMKFNLSYQQYNSDFRDTQAFVAEANPSQQISNSLEQPLRTVGAITKGIMRSGTLASFIGTLGWQDTRLPIPFLLLAASGLLFLVLTESSPHVWPWRFRWLTGAVFAGISFLLGAALYAIWTPLAANAMQGFHGRFLLPIAPLLPAFLFIPHHSPWLEILRKQLIILLPGTVVVTTLLAIWIRYYH